MATTQLQKILTALQRTYGAAKESTNRRILRDPLDMILYKNGDYLVSDAQHWAAFDELNDQLAQTVALLRIEMAQTYIPETRLR
jgi:hypothetical protein